MYTFTNDLAGKHTREWGSLWRNSWFKAENGHDGWYTQVDRLHNDFDIVEAWKVAWFKAGWIPKILTLEDAEENVVFFKLVSSLIDDLNLEESEKSYFYRWVAMAQAVPEGGGWMSDVDVLPLHISSVFGLDLPNEGSLTFYDSDTFSLVSGSKAEWNNALKFLVSFLNLNKNKEFSHTNFLALLESRHAVVQPEVVPGCSFIGISIVDCEKYPNNMKAVKFSGPEKGDCVSGGWLESELKEKFGKSARLSFRFVRSNNLQFSTNLSVDPYIFQDPHYKLYQVITRANVKHLEVKVDGTELGSVTDVFNSHKSRIALMFMERQYNQCP